MGGKRAKSVLFFRFCLLLIFMAFTGNSVTAQPSLSILDAIIPPSLLVPAGSDVQQILFGAGVQMYTYNGTAWLLTNVSTDLYDFRGQKVGHHFFLNQTDSNGGRATWEIFHPFSRVSGKTLVSVPSPFSVSGIPKDSINWLLVKATSHIDKTYLKYLGSTTYVQRLYTHGGLAPSFPGETGGVFDSNYTALYKFSSNCTSV